MKLNGGFYWIFLLLIVGMTIWMAMQQSRQQKNRQRLQNSLNVGERVVTVGGIIGTIACVNDKDIELEVGNGVVIPVLRSAIGSRYQG